MALRGASQSEINRQHREAMQRFESQIEAARAMLAGDIKALTPREGQALCRRWYVERLEEEEPKATPGEYERWNLEYELLLDEAAPVDEEDAQRSLEERYHPSKGDLEHAKQFLSCEGIAADVPSIRLMAVSLWQAKLRLADTMRRRCGGYWGEDEHLASFPPPSGSSGSRRDTVEAQKPDRASLSFTALVDAWAAETQPLAKTLEKWRAAFASFERVIGHDDITKATVADVRSWKEARQAAGRSAKTIGDGIAVMRATVNWGIRNGLVVGPNHFANMAPRTAKRGPSVREGFTDQEAAAILNEARKAEGWLRWLPWVLAFTGARIDEIAGLRRDDIRQESGVWVIDIRPNEERRLKTAQSQRLVPIHPALVAEGFLKYVETLPTGPLWPDLEPGRYGRRSSTATKTHSRWVRGKVGILEKKSKAPAHSWRHRMEDELRKARVLPEITDAITGHNNPRNAGAGYGRGYRGMPEVLAEELEKVPPPVGVAVSCGI